METISQKKSIFPMKNNFGHFFLVLARIWQTSRYSLLGFTRYSGNRYASNKIISVTHQRLLKTQSFGQKASFSA